MTAHCFRGMVVDVDLEPVVGHEQGKRRPCVVVQNDIGNRYSPVTIVVPLTGAEHVPKLSPIHVLVRKGEAGLRKDSVILCNQIRAVDQRRLRTVHGTLTDSAMKEVGQALRRSLAL